MQAATREINELEFNSIREKFSVAYLYALNAYLNYAIQPSSKDYDDIGIDFGIINKTIGPGRTVGSEGNTIHIQIKGVSISSTSMIKDVDNHIKYKLSKSLSPIGTHFLVIVVLPDVKDIDAWCKVTEEELILRKCAYYLHIPNILSPGFVKIPKENILNLETFPKLFDYAKRIA